MKKISMTLVDDCGMFGDKKLTRTQQGKKNKRDGAKFELSVRKYLENEGWIVSKWMNNVDLEENKLIPSKHKFCGMGRPMTIGTGFPDFLAFMKDVNGFYRVIGVEAKSNGRLDKEERDKMDWLLQNVFKSFWIISKGDDSKFNIDIREVM